MTADCKLSKISDHAYCLPPVKEHDRPLLGVVAGSRATLIIDAGNSTNHAHYLLTELTNLAIARPSYVVLTHWHWDHVFGSSAFEFEIISHKKTKAYLKGMRTLDWSDSALDQRVKEGSEIAFCRDMIKLELPDRSQMMFKIPDISFTSELEIDLGGVSCQIKHVGGDHAEDSSIVFIPEDGIAFLGDCLYEDIHHGSPRYTLNNIQYLSDFFRCLNADEYYLAHDKRSMTNSDLISFFHELLLIGEVVDKFGKDKERIKKFLASHNNSKNCKEFDGDLVDSFINGLD